MTKAQIRSAVAESEPNLKELEVSQQTSKLLLKRTKKSLGNMDLERKIKETTTKPCLRYIKMYERQKKRVLKIKSSAKDKR